MRSRSTGSLALGLLWIIASSSPTAEGGETLTDLESALAAAKDYRYGENEAPLKTIERFAVDAIGPESSAREAVESRLLDALSGEGSTEFKAFLCRQLRTVGGGRSIPLLERLLASPELSHMARFALGRIPDPEAARALHRAASRLEGKQLAGVLGTLGERRHAPAIALLVKHLGSSDPSVAAAAANALGRVGTGEAANELVSARAKASDSLRPFVDNALFVCAERLAAGGDMEAAASIYARFLTPDHPSHLRVGALNGLASTDRERVGTRLLRALTDRDPAVRASAVALTGSVPGTELTQKLVSRLPALEADTRSRLIRSLGSRGDRVALGAVRDALESEHEPTRVAALFALGRIGTAADVARLAEAAASKSGAAQTTARASLVRITAPGAEDAIVSGVLVGDAAQRRERIRALRDRRAGAAFETIVRAASADDAGVRADAFDALGRLADASTLGELTGLVGSTRADERGLAAKAIESAFRRVRDPALRLNAIRSALDASPVDAKPTLVGILKSIASAESLTLAWQAAKSSETSVRRAAIETIAAWPDSSPADALLAAVPQLTDPREKRTALRGFVRMAQQSEEPVARVNAAFEVCSGPEERAIVLDGLAAVGDETTLALVLGKLSSSSAAEVELAAAARAAVRIADRIRSKDTAVASRALESVVAKTGDAKIRAEAQDVLGRIHQFEGHIRLWQISGPYQKNEADFEAVFAAEFRPESADGNAAWKQLRRGVGAWDIDLTRMMGALGNAAAYVRTRIASPTARGARLELGSDDAVKVWLNGKLVHAKLALRGLSPRSDVVPVELRQGSNELLLKIVNSGGGWSFCCRVRNADGSALDDIQISLPTP